MGVRWETLPGERVSIGEVAVTPRFRQVVAQWGGGRIVLGQPTDVLVEEGGRRQRRPICDVTRLVQSVLILGGVVTAVATLVSRSNAKEEAP